MCLLSGRLFTVDNCLQIEEYERSGREIEQIQNSSCVCLCVCVCGGSFVPQTREQGCSVRPDSVYMSFKWQLEVPESPGSEPQ